MRELFRSVQRKMGPPWWVSSAWERVAEYGLPHRSRVHFPPAVFYRSIGRTKIHAQQCLHPSTHKNSCHFCVTTTRIAWQMPLFAKIAAVFFSFLKHKIAAVDIQYKRQLFDYILSSSYRTSQVKNFWTQKLMNAWSFLDVWQCLNFEIYSTTVLSLCCSFDVSQTSLSLVNQVYKRRKKKHKHIQLQTKFIIVTYLSERRKH